MANNLNKLSQEEHANNVREIATLRFGRHQYDVELVQPWSHDRKEVEQFTHDIYALRYKADISQFLPHMVAMRHSESKQLVASAGFQTTHSDTDNKTLFLEQYLDFPIEKAASAVGRRRFQRSDFVEVGNLAGAITGAGHLITLTLAEYLTKQGYDWIAFTLTRNMVRAFESLKLQPISLVGASEERVSDDRTTWGSYFNTRPEVMIGDMQSAYQKMKRMGLYSSISYQAYNSSENQLSKQGLPS